MIYPLIIIFCLKTYIALLMQPLINIIPLISHLLIKNFHHFYLHKLKLHILYHLIKLIMKENY